MFEVLVRRYQSRVLAHVGRMVGNRDDALDLSQEIFLKVFGALNRLQPLLQVLDLALPDRRQRGDRPPAQAAPADGAPGGPGADGGMSSVEYKSHDLDPYGELRNLERGNAIERAISACRSNSGNSLRLRHFGGLSYEEIAEVKQMPLGHGQEQTLSSQSRIEGKVVWRIVVKTLCSPAGSDRRRGDRLGGGSPLCPGRDRTRAGLRLLRAGRFRRGRSCGKSTAWGRPGKPSRRRVRRCSRPGQRRRTPAPLLAS